MRIDTVWVIIRRKIKMISAALAYKINGISRNGSKITAFNGSFSKTVTVFMVENLISVERLTTPLRKKNGISTHLILWSIRNGKGFDDLVINKGQRYAQYLKSIPYQTFEVAYAVTLKEVLQKFGCESVRDIRQEDIQRFTNTMQSQMETTVGIKTP
jgi:hypothetical protein